VPSGESDVLTVPWGQPFPEVWASSMVMVLGCAWRGLTGLAKASAGRKIKIVESMMKLLLGGDLEIR